MSEEERQKLDVAKAKELNKRTCERCHATVGWVNGNRYRREVESKRHALSQLATVTAERDEARREVERQRHSADIAAHVVVESGYIPGDGCRCEMCREVAIRMSDAGYLSKVKDRWWEAAALNTEGKQG